MAKSKKTAKKTINPKLIIIAVMAIFALGFVLFSNYGLVKRINLELQKKELIEDIKKEKKLNDSLKIRINKIKNDDIEIERIAREKYGMIKPGEKVYIKKKKESD